ncbi:MAG: S-(hydroxymethyl)glutathione dehydrogenase / alcohol dehydrogenase [Nocardioidaceae bacterium]|nr:S-(hydroxymethyl)glutathione dehydrogenase / alcohol dehydrogenase [Nocardioidaceae bacterium]
MSISERRPVRAAVLNTPGHLDLETLWVDSPGPREIRVRPVAVGLCHSDLHYIDGTHTTHLPEVLGHEAAGVVEQVGDQVTAVKVGDHVVTSLTMFCGRCRYCVTGRMSLCSERAALRHRPRPSLVDSQGGAVGVMGGIGAFAELAVMHENAVTAVRPTLPMPVASLFGCAVLTGVGAVTRAAQVPVGATVAVVGCGGIGLAAVQGAVLAGASRIVAVDRSSTKRDAARSFGATDVLISDERTVDRSREVLPEGVDFTFEAVGRAETAELAFALLAPGGTCTVLGMVPDATPIHVPPSALYFHEKKLQGAFIGSSRFTADIPALAQLYTQGRLALDQMITHTFELDRINDAFTVLVSGDALRVVLRMPGA